MLNSYTDKQVSINGKGKSPNCCGAETDFISSENMYFCRFCSESIPIANFEKNIKQWKLKIMKTKDSIKTFLQSADIGIMSAIRSACRRKFPATVAQLDGLSQSGTRRNSKRRFALIAENENLGNRKGDESGQIYLELKFLCI